MAERTAQHYSNHTRLHPLFHMFLLPVAGINILAAAWHLFRHPGLWAAWFVILALAGATAIVMIRTYALKVQDRVIRLEELLRMERLLPAPLKSRVYEITEQQFIALRFASDGEIPTLVEKTLAGNLEPKAIKAAIQSWRPDYWRV